ncbi:peptide deformylase [Leptolyngbya sp. AN02str]
MTQPLPIAQLGHSVLRQIAAPVPHGQDAWVRSLVNELLVTLQASNGVGIAAPQVGHSYRVVVVASRPNARYPHAPQIQPIALINPEVVRHSDDVVRDWEGCLSVPGVRGLVPRYTSVEVEYTTVEGDRVTQEFHDFVARIFQHEFDHLNGLVFVDRVETQHDLIDEQEYFTRVLAQQSVSPAQ